MCIRDRFAPCHALWAGVKLTELSLRCGRAQPWGTSHELDGNGEDCKWLALRIPENTTRALQAPSAHTQSA
eukprot:12152394-Alexandrium_andersonii.AAC.1